MYARTSSRATRTRADRHNTIRMLTEAASARCVADVAEREQLTGTLKGLPTIKHPELPEPWEGGNVVLRGIVETTCTPCSGGWTAARSTATGRCGTDYRMGRNQPEKARTQAPFAFVVPARERTCADGREDDQHPSGGRDRGVPRELAVHGGRQERRRRAYVILDGAVVPECTPRRSSRNRRIRRAGSPGRSRGAAVRRDRLDASDAKGVDVAAVQNSFTFQQERVDKAVPPVVTLAAKATRSCSRPTLNDWYKARNRIIKDGGKVLRRRPHQVGVQVPAGAFVVPVAAKGAKGGRLREGAGYSRHSAGERAGQPGPGHGAATADRLYQAVDRHHGRGLDTVDFEQYEVAFTNLTDADVKASCRPVRRDRHPGHPRQQHHRGTAQARPTDSMSVASARKAWPA